MVQRRPADHLVVGLGNPGARYAATRHNLGFRVVDRLADRHRADGWQETGLSQVARIEIEGRQVVLAKPQTFMNRSGEAVGPLLARLDLEAPGLVVIHDDLDLPFGRLRIRPGGGHGGHRGVGSIMGVLGCGDFTRLKIGIGRPEEGREVVDFVLSPFDPSEEVVLSDLLARAADALESIVVEGPLRAMHQFHSN